MKSIFRTVILIIFCFVVYKIVLYFYFNAWENDHNDAKYKQAFEERKAVEDFYSKLRVFNIDSISDAVKKDTLLDVKAVAYEPTDSIFYVVATHNKSLNDSVYYHFCESYDLQHAYNILLVSFVNPFDPQLNKSPEFQPEQYFSVARYGSKYYQQLKKNK